MRNYRQADKLINTISAKNISNSGRYLAVLITTLSSKQIQQRYENTVIFTGDSIVYPALEKAMYIYDEKNNTWVALRSTQEYKKKRKIARDYWIIALLAMGLLPLGAIIFLIFLMTFLTFTFLDESIYHFNQEES